MAGTDGRLRFFFVGMTSLPALSRNVTKLLPYRPLLEGRAVLALVLVQFHDEPAALLLLE